MREVREYGKSIDPPTSKEEGDMRIEIWTIREEHLVFEKVDGYLWYLADNLINFVAD